MRPLLRLAIRFAVLGLLAAVGGAVYAKSRLTSRGEPDDETIDLVGIFAGFELESRATSFRGGTLLAWFGGGTLDLREATLAPEGARLSVRALFGGAQVIVPEGWDVTCELVGIAGGLGDDRELTEHDHDHDRGRVHDHNHDDDRHHLHDGPEAGGRPILVIDGWAAFGGVGVTSERRGPAPG